MHEFLMGATAMGCWTAMLFFLRFWRESRDRLFAMFSAAFLLLGLTRFGLASRMTLVKEKRTYIGCDSWRIC